MSQNQQAQAIGVPGNRIHAPAQSLT